MITSLEGDNSTGKSSFIYSGRLPIVSLAFDAGSDRSMYGSRWRLFEKVDIKTIQYPPDMSDMKAHHELWRRNNGQAITVYLLPTPLQTSGTRVTGMSELWTAFIKLYNEAVWDEKILTVGVDTATIARLVAADSFLQGMQMNQATSGRVQLIQIEWAKPGSMMRSLYSTAQNQVEVLAARGLEKHVIFTHHVREVRDNVPDGKGEVHSIVRKDSRGSPIMELEGLGSTYKFVDIALRLTQTTIPSVLDKNQKEGAIEGEFLKCGFDLSLRGSKIINPDWDTVARYINPNIHPSHRIKLRDEE